MSDAVWLAILGIVAMFLKEYFDRQRSNDAKQAIEQRLADTKEALAALAKKRDADAAEVKQAVAAVAKVTDEKAAEVKQAVAIAVTEAAKIADEKAADVKLALQGAVNTMVDVLPKVLAEAQTKGT